MEELLDRGADIEQRGYMSPWLTPLQIAAGLGRGDAVKLLLLNADVRAADCHQMSSMDWAEKEGFREIVELLKFLSGRSSL